MSVLDTKLYILLNYNSAGKCRIKADKKIWYY